MVHGLVGRLRENLVDVILFIKTFKTMRHNLTIRERMLRAFAAVMRTVCPVLSVKYFTIWFPEGQSWHYQDSKEKARLFLPGESKEYKAIQKLALSEDAIRRRVWSPETEIVLLKQRNFALISNIKSNNTEALDLVCMTNNQELIAKVFSQATPSATYLKDWLKKTDESVVVDVIKRVPTVFNDLHYDDIENLNYIGTLINCALDVDASKQTKKAAQQWAEEVVTRKEYMESSLTNKPEMADLFDSAMQVLVNADYNFTKYLEKLERYHESWYGNIRYRAAYSAYVEDYIIERLPEIWFCAKFNENGTELESFDESYHGENWPKVVDARQWLKLASVNIYEPEVAKKALDVITDLTYARPCGAIIKMQKALVEGISTFHVAEMALAKLPEQYRWQIQSKLYEAITTADEAKKAFKLLPKSYRKGLRAKLVEKTIERDASILLSYWPFNGWEEETTEKAVRKLAEVKKLPLNKLEELPLSLQMAGLEELEILSEIAAIGRSYYGDLQKELMKQKFHARSEMYLFCLDYNWQELKKLYITYNEMDEASFRVLVNFRGTGYGGDEERIKDLIHLHATTWGLTEGEYRALMQSPYSPMAADLKQYLKKDEPIADEDEMYEQNTEEIETSADAEPTAEETSTEAEIVGVGKI